MLDTLPPEMERVPLDKPVLGVIWEGERPQSYLRDVMHPPPCKEVVRAEARLRRLRLVMGTKITALGSFVYRIDPHLGVIMMKASQFDQHALMARVVTVISQQRVLATGEPLAQRKHLSMFRTDVHSDVYAEVSILLEFEALDHRRHDDFCKKNGLRKTWLYQASKDTERLFDMFCERSRHVSPQATRQSYDIPHGEDDLQYCWPFLASLLLAGLGDNIVQPRGGSEPPPLKLHT